MVSRPFSQNDIFANYGWYEKHNLLYRITSDRCNYIESRIERVFGRNALAQQEILEVGCGGGLICRELARRGAVATGIDPVEGALADARRYVQQGRLGHNVSFDHGYAESLPYADGSFSVIVCLDVLEHVRDLQATIHEIARVLAPGGIFVFDTINRTLLARLVLIQIGERFFQKQGLVPGLHHYEAFIKPAELQSLISRESLQVQELTGFMPKVIEGRVALAPGWFKGVSYIGYATKGR
ncbi:bifunctional 2-polyprenyl-6-hydroxyphenol methylase/3-demethylubiquinol 3-O-methyltransferase UbiG [Dictyobacter formicarum]|uniref:Ubiquinone biosynthesis O-methyltransferase n=1 Tax=Dictyobacter formicarum TaxID=2778368 RepID=A0ABQ3VHB9_9CHLR|nr:bifunctional 2-polyprenyl-6-hydroxyphenol methylase/3-demethylubiquinol 3-O-methyltransferase UbiG [Dictyobacter formicarum]GHO85435.1 ubiquinone biosynthesis O-methyltransferase [Dictyobacter formicarum]